MIESLGVTRDCWRRAVRATESGLQITWHDGNRCPGPKQDPGRHAVVVGYPRTRLDGDCSGGRVKQVETVRCLYTADEAEAAKAFQDAVEYAQECRKEPAKALLGPQRASELGYWGRR